MQREREIRINLLQYKKDQQRFRYERLFCFLLLIGAGMALAAGFITGTFMLRQDIAVLQQANEKMRAECIYRSSLQGAVQENEDLYHDMVHRQQLLRDLEEERMVASSMLHELGTMELKGMSIIDTKVDAQKVLIKGYASKYEVLIAFLDWIRESAYFSSVVDMETRQDEKSGILSFSITLTWKGQQS
ncbi:MAG TPA: hypothetical protein GX404_06395 [Syntrophomonadaceae bacterium]|nr:hypothetical protein [Syntrophomonadaceae bacterium]